MLMGPAFYLFWVMSVSMFTKINPGELPTQFKSTMLAQNRLGTIPTAL